MVTRVVQRYGHGTDIQAGLSLQQDRDGLTSSSRYMACLKWISGIFSLHERRAKSKAKSNVLES